MKSENWDNKERKKEERKNRIEKGEELLKIYCPLVEKYAKLNDIEIPPEDDNDHLPVLYGFVWDAKFIDFAYDESGIIFNEDMFTLDDEITEEDLKKFGFK